jgi:hypothetical protein
VYCGLLVAGTGRRNVQRVTPAKFVLNPFLRDRS